MAIRLYSEDEILSLALGHFAALFPGVDLSDRGYFGLLARAFAQTVVLAQYAIEQAADDSVPAYQQDADGNVRSRCSSAALDAWAFVFGLPSGRPGVYGRRGATVSTGGLGTPSGTAGVLIPAGTQATDPTSQLVVQTVAAVTLNGPPNTLPVQFVSVTEGAKANLPAGTVLTWIAPPVGLASTVVLSAPLRGAEDAESDSELVARLLRRIQQPPRGGTAADYRAWTEESVDSSGGSLNIFRAFVFPLRDGLGSVTVVPTYEGSGTGRQPPAGEIAKVQAALNRLRPITATVFVRAPYMPAANALRVRVTASPSSAKNGLYLWDYDDGGISTGFTAHTANSLTCTTVPAGLQAAFAAGRKPRIQVIISTPGASTLPFVARVINIVGNVLTLDTPFAVQPTDGVDYFWAGGALVTPIAARIQAYIDSLGPSRQSGFADPNDAWEDTVLLERITDVVMETRDADGTRMVLSTPGFGGKSVQIAVGSGLWSGAPYQPRDIGFGIELAYLRGGGIEVLQK
ncbi:MAG: baseplate J/gp47 family protein [Polyangia bacterium]